MTLRPKLAIHGRIGHWGSLESSFYQIFERSTGLRIDNVKSRGLTYAARSKICSHIKGEEKTTLLEFAS